MRNTRAIIILLLALSPAVFGTANGSKEDRFGIKIEAEPVTALVFVDGRFVGQSRPGSPLTAVLKKAEFQLRLTSAGYLDSIHQVKLKAGKMMTFQCKLMHSKQEDKWVPPTTPILLASGQTVRGVVTKEHKVTYKIESKGEPHQFILGLQAHPTFRVLDSKGQEIKVVRLKNRVSGAPGSKYWEYKGGAPGPHTLELSGDAGHFAFELATGLPGICETDNPRLKGRRKAPRMPKK